MILVLNCGSQSIKWKVFDRRLNVAKEGSRTVLDTTNFRKDLQGELEKVRGLDIHLIGHRVVHGKDIFIKPTEITKNNIKTLESLSALDPLHNPFNVLGIKACQNIFPEVQQIAVFDTEFFKGLPDKAFTYALPEKFVKEFGFHRYGFHGIGHEYAVKMASEQLERPAGKLKMITCHLGGGSSITAVGAGKAVDTSMGFTPMQGLVMMTRAGDIDAGIVLELAKKYGVEKTGEILNKKSGLKGICGQGEMLKVLEKIKAGDKSAKLALDVFVYSIQKYIGAYFAILGGCDALVFTGTIGYGSKKIRDMVCKGMDILKNTKILAIEPNEELAIAKKALSVK